MSERYSRLFALSENQYAGGSPVVIAAGALLKDNQTGKVIAQLKLRNISKKAIKAAKVCISPFDTVGNPIGDSVSFQYLDLSAKRDEDFGQKAAITLPNAATRSFAATVEEIAFADNTIWKATGEPWEVLPVPSSIGRVHGAEFEKQFRMKYGADSKNLPLFEKDLWYCACGALNRIGEPECHICGKAYAEMSTIDYDALHREKNVRVAAEKEQAEKAAAAVRAREEAARAKAKKAGKIAAIIVPILAIIIVAAVIVSGMVKKSNAYNDALALMDAEQYEEAIIAFTALDGYKDSAKQIQIAETELDRIKTYDDALAFLEAREYQEAYAAFELLGDYKDAQKYLDRFQWEYMLTSEISKVNGKDFYDKSYEYSGELLTKETAIGKKTSSVSELFMFHGYNLDLGDTCYAEYDYDANGKVVEIRVYREDGYQIHTYTYQYDSNGNLVKETDISSYANGTHSWYTYEYDERGNKTSRRWYHVGEEGVYSTNYYEYDEHNQLIRSGFEYEWGAKQDITYDNEYDNRDRLIRQVSLSTPSGYCETYEYEYDDSDNVIVMRKIVKDWIHEYNYEYDNQGNLLKQTINSHNESETKEQIITYTYSKVLTFE